MQPSDVRARRGRKRSLRLGREVPHVEKRLLEGRFGVYRLSGLLERTSWCNVYRAYRVQRSLFHAREIFAAKEVFLDFDNPHQQRVALDEFGERASRYLGLSHPSLARVVDFLVSGACHYTLFEFVPGMRLGLLLDRQDTPTAEDLVFQLAADAVRALRYLHSQGIVFGDLSASSIIVTPQGHARLTDYGLSRHLQLQRPDEPLLGTRGYAPAEQYGSEAVLTPRCDLYALGAVLWRCLTLQDPAEHPAPLPRVRALNPSVSKWMEGFVERLLEVDAARRPMDADDAWGMLVAHDPSLDEPPPLGVGAVLALLFRGRQGGRGNGEKDAGHS